MIKLVGLKRMIFLVAMLTLNAAAAAIYFLSVSPMLDDAERERDVVNGQISSLQGKLSSVKADMTYVNENMPQYKALQDRGFFLSQDRFMIGRTMEDLRNKAGISSFSFSVADVTEIPNPEAAAIGYKLINSRIKVDNIVSPLDTNVYMLAQEMGNVFPNFARLQTMDLQRVAEVNPASLKDIADGKAVNFVNSSVEFDWITMVPKVTDVSGGAAGQNGFRGQ